MVWLVVEDGESAVELLHEKEAHHLVVEGHLRQGDFVVGNGVNRGREAEGAADDEDEGAGAGIHLFLQVLGETHRGVLLAVLVEQHDAVGTLQPFEEQHPFALFDVVGRGVALVFEGGNHFYVEVHVVLEAFDIDVDAFLQIGGVGFGDNEELDVHFFGGGGGF